MSEEIEQQNQEELRGKEIPVPLYFDRYVAGELRSLRDGIANLKDSMDERFTQVDRRIDELKDSIDERFIQFEKRIDERFVQMDRRIDNLKDSMDERSTQVDKRFDKLNANIKWTIGLFLPVVGGILAIIVKMFFGP